MIHKIKKYIVEIHNLSFSHNNYKIFDNISFNFPFGKVTAIMGPSGIGKTTLLKLIGGQLKPDFGKILFLGDNISILSRKKLYEKRKQIGMLFQSGALFTDLTIYENIAWPLKEHTKLPISLLHSTVMMKLEIVGLRNVAYLKPSSLSSGMIRRAAIARAIALDPDLIMLDEPFVGQDPITKYFLVNLIDKLNHILNVSCILVSHDIKEVLSIAHYAYIIFKNKIIAQGNILEIKNNPDFQVRQFIKGKINKSVSLCSNSNDYFKDLTNLRKS